VHVLITGGAGFIGSHTARALVERGDRVRILDAFTEPVHAEGWRPNLPEAAQVVRGDVRSKPDWIEALDGVDAVIHLAAYQDYGLDFSRFLHVNAAGTALMYEAIVERGFDVRRVAYASSQSVYGEGQVRCDDHGVVAAAQRRAEDLARGDWDVRCSMCGWVSEPAPMTERFASPHNAYGISKLAGEQAALTLGEQHGVPTVALRYAIVHGPEQSPRNAYSGLLRAACLSHVAGRAPVVFEDGAQLRDYVAIDDVVSANLTALEVLEALDGIVDTPRAPEVPGIFRLGDVRHTIGDLSAMRALGWEPHADLPAMWASYWEWLKGLELPPDVAGDALAHMEAQGILRKSNQTA
jgi:dTDP-L-rhamnose 4-epimerase